MDRARCRTNPNMSCSDMLETNCRQIEGYDAILSFWVSFMVTFQCVWSEGYGILLRLLLNYLYPLCCTAEGLVATFSFFQIIVATLPVRMEPNEIYDLVQARYGELGGRSYSSEHTAAERSVAESFGYEASELSSIPEAANLGVSCGNPLALANLREVSSNRTLLVVLHRISANYFCRERRLSTWAVAEALMSY